MKRKIIALMALAVLGTSFVPYTSFAEESSISHQGTVDSELRAILPESDDTYENFINTYGNVSIHGKYIVYCDTVNFAAGMSVVTKQEGPAEIKEVEHYNIPEPPSIPIDGAPIRMVYIYEAVTPGSVHFVISQGQTWKFEETQLTKSSACYSVSEDMTIKPINKVIYNTGLGYLPQTMEEYNEFIAKYGSISTHGKYIVYCDEINYSTGDEVIIEQNGTAEIKETGEYSIKPDTIPVPGSSSHAVYVYEAVTPGVTELKISQGRPWENADKKKIKDVSDYVVAEDLTVVRSQGNGALEGVAGDVNSDGEFNIADLVLLQKWLLGIPDTELKDWKAADLCRDDVIDVYDICLMKKALTSALSDAPSYEIIETKAFRDNTNVENIKKGIYKAETYEGLLDIISKYEACTEENCSCNFHDAASLIPEGIDEDFFKDNIVIAVYNSSGGSNKKLTVNSVEISGDTLIVNTTTEYPYLATPDVAYYRSIIGVSKSFCEGILNIERNDADIAN